MGSNVVPSTPFTKRRGRYEAVVRAGKDGNYSGISFLRCKLEGPGMCGTAEEAQTSK